MIDQLPRIEETVARPDELRVSNQDESVHLFYRHYAESPVTIRSVPMAQRKRTQKDKQYNQLSTNMNWEAQRDMDQDMEENKELYLALADTPGDE